MKESQEVLDMINGISQAAAKQTMDTNQESIEKKVDDPAQTNLFKEEEQEGNVEEPTEESDTIQEERGSEEQEEELPALEVDGITYESEKVAEALELLNGKSNLAKRIEWVKSLDEDLFNESSNQFIASKVASEKYQQASELQKKAEDVVIKFNQTQDSLNLEDYLSPEFVEQFPKEAETFRKAASLIEGSKEMNKVQSEISATYMLRTTLNVVKDKVPEYKHMNLAEFSTALKDTNHPDHINVKIAVDLMEKSNDAYDVASKLNNHFGKTRKQQESETKEAVKKKSIKYKNVESAKTTAKKQSVLEQAFGKAISNNKEREGAAAYWGR
jgi:hypothetical protein